MKAGLWWSLFWSAWGLAAAWAQQPGLDAFSRPGGAELRQLVQGSKPLLQLRASQAQSWPRLGPGVQGPTLIVRTDQGNWSKVELDWAFRRQGTKLVPVVVLVRFVTYRAESPDQVLARGEQRMLFPGFRFDLDLGQVVPQGLGEDLWSPEGKGLRAGAGAALFAWKKPLPREKNSEQYDPWAHPEVRPRDFQGTWHLDADGRLQGRLVLTVDERGSVNGQFISQSSGSRYEVWGKVQLATPHRLRLVIKLANSQQLLELYLWTSTKETMAGTCQLETQRYGAWARRLSPRRKPSP